MAVIAQAQEVGRQLKQRDGGDIGWRIYSHLPRPGLPHVPSHLRRWSHDPFAISFLPTPNHRICQEAFYKSWGRKLQGPPHQTQSCIFFLPPFANLQPKRAVVNLFGRCLIDLSGFCTRSNARGSRGPWHLHPLVKHSMCICFYQSV